MAAAAAAAKTLAWWRHEKKKQDFFENLENEKIAKTHRTNRLKNVDLRGTTKKRTSPSNSTRKTTPIDLFSSPYD